MHDPLTLVCRLELPLWGHHEIRSPDGAHVVHRARRTLPLLEVWHRDPERGGGDDSCGWSYARLTEEQEFEVDRLASEEAKSPTFSVRRAQRLEDADQRGELADRLVSRLALALGVRLTPAQWHALAEECAAHDDFAFLPGWHEHLHQSEVEARWRWARSWFRRVARRVLTAVRPWWRHPRWHVWHWRVRWVLGTRLLYRLAHRCPHCRRLLVLGPESLTRAEGRSWHSRCYDARRRPDRGAP